MVRNESQLRVLIVRLGAMGDILHALPAITALRAAHPGWMLGWAVEPQWRALLAADSCPLHGCAARGPSMPLVDRIHTVAAKQWGRSPLTSATLRDLLRSRRDLREPGYDIAIDLQGAVRSAVIARWARPSRLLGEAQPREPIARCWFTERIATRGTHVIEQAADVARAVANDALPLGLPVLPIDDAATAWALAHAPASPFVLLSPGAGWGAKRWPIERYAAVARALASADGLPVVVNASPAERVEAGQLADAAPGVTVLAPTLSQLVALSRQAALTIAGDTGPLHLAAALGRPTVGIFGPTDPARNGPFHGEYRILRHPESRRDHTRRSEPETGLLTITPEEVLAAARLLLAGGKANKGAISAAIPTATPATAHGLALGGAPAAISSPTEQADDSPAAAAMSAPATRVPGP